MRSSATTMSSSASNGSLPSSRATSPTLRPSNGLFSAANVSLMTYVCQFATPTRCFPPPAASSRAARPSGLASIAFFSSCGSAIGFCQPGIVSSRKPLSKQIRGDGASGSVSASTRPPRSAA
ncbi:MAG: hypothetical protein KatS3mg010_0208 [Acidimicrobiia bacterium]|nr:MAG: hypothetical protein KatS3mg010_0208 [Acidimicrobiia bacterium]